MTAQTESIDFYLIKLATIISGLILANYILWSLNTPPVFTTIPVVLMLITVGVFLTKSSFNDYWPIKLFIVSIALISLGSPSNDWDARSIWLFHAKRIFFENNLYAQLDGLYAWSHNDYPTLVPALSATLAKIIGHWNEVFPKFSSVLAFIPAIFLLSSAFKYRLQKLLLYNLLLFILHKYFINGYMDGILASYFTAASFLLYILTGPAGEYTFDVKQRRWLYFLALFIFSSLTLIKNEGLVLFAILILAAFLTRLKFQMAGISATIVQIILTSLVPIAIWKIICLKSGISNDLAHSNLSTQLTGRIVLIDNYLKIFTALIFNSRFVLPTILFVLSVIGAKRRIAATFIALSSLLYFCVLFAVYLSTPADLTVHLKTSASRTILPIALSLGFYSLLFSRIERIGENTDFLK